MLFLVSCGVVYEELHVDWWVCWAYERAGSGVALAGMEDPARPWALLRAGVGCKLCGGFLDGRGVGGGGLFVTMSRWRGFKLLVVLSIGFEPDSIGRMSLELGASLLSNWLGVHGYLQDVECSVSITP